MLAVAAFRGGEALGHAHLPAVHVEDVRRVREARRVELVDEGLGEVERVVGDAIGFHPLKDVVQHALSRRADGVRLQLGVPLENLEGVVLAGRPELGLGQAAVVVAAERDRAVILYGSWPLISTAWKKPCLPAARRSAGRSIWSGTAGLSA